MAQVLITEAHLQAIAAAIRQKLHGEDTYTPAQMADAILSISGGTLEALIATANGEYPPGEGLDGYSDVTVNVPSLTAYMDDDVLVLGGNAVSVDGEVVILDSLPVLSGKEITQNGTYQPSDDDADGYSAVTVSVGTNLGTKTINANGIYAASADSLDGYTSVTVRVGVEYVATAAANPSFPFAVVSASFSMSALSFAASAAEVEV